MSDLTEAARGHWPDLLASLAGLSSEQLTDRHQPCPLCGGTDRYRFDDKDGSGSWFCNQCGGKHGSGGAGNGWDMLMRRTGLSYNDAAQRVEQHLGIAPRIQPPTQGAEAFWRYSDSFIVCRFPGKKIRPLFWDGAAWRWKAPPSPRPLLNLHLLLAKPTSPVLVVEGEKTADAAARLFPGVIATTWPSGCKAVDKADWSPLAGRQVILWPDNDDVGRQAMERIASKLLRLPGTTLKLVSNPPDAPEAWDLANASWTPQEASDYSKANTKPIDGGAPPPSQAPFTCLGFDGDSYFYQPAATGQVIRITASGHSGVNLCRLAPLSHWEALYPSKSSVNWTAAASDLFAQQAQIGVYDPDRIRGRGAWWDQGRAILHLGDHLLVNGNRHDLQHGLPGSRYHYQRLAAIDSPTVTPLTDPEAYEILDLANRFHWDVPASGLLLAGWVTLAPICGALDWRPHAWLTAAAGTGKSELLNKFIGPLLGPISLWPLGSSTEAFLRQELRCDALPVVFDEAESNEQNDKARIQAVLALARVASSSGRGVVGRGSADGQAQRFTIRSMFLLSSISTALKQGADRTRFAQLSLRNPSELPPEQRAAHWTALKADLERIISETTGHRLQARTIALIPIIRQSTAIFRDAAGAYFQNQRLGDQYGTLLAGAYALQCSTVPTQAEALALIRQQNWEPYQQATELTDEQACLQTLLQHQLRIESRDGALTRTVAELVEIAARRTTSLQIEASTAEDLLGRHGFRVQEDQLLISNTATAIEKILAVTPWASCWPMTLVRIDGATRPGIARFKGIGVSRCVGIPLQTVTV